MQLNLNYSEYVVLEQTFKNIIIKLLLLCSIFSKKRVSASLLMNDKVMIRYGRQRTVMLCATVEVLGLSETSFSTFLSLRHVSFITLMRSQSLKLLSDSHAPSSGS